MKSLGTGTLAEIITGVCACCESEKPEAERDHRENVSRMCQRHSVEMKAPISATGGGSMMWAVVLLSWIWLVIVLTGCVEQPVVWYRDPQTGMLCSGRLDADELRCTTPTPPPGRNADRRDP